MHLIRLVVDSQNFGRETVLNGFYKISEFGHAFALYETYCKTCLGTKVRNVDYKGSRPVSP